MTLACLRLLGQAGPLSADPALQREKLMLLVLLAVIGMVCLLATAVKTRKLKMVIAVGAGIFAVLIVLSVVANLSMWSVRPQPVTYLPDAERQAVAARAAEAQAEAFRTFVSSKAILQSDSQASSAEAEALPQRQQLFSDVVDTWLANTYPSDKSAIQALVARVNKEWMAAAGYQEPSEIRVQGKVRHELLLLAVDALRQMHSETRISLVQTQGEDIVSWDKEPDVVVVRLEAPTPRDKQFMARASVSVSGRTGSFSEQVQFVEKPWLEDFAAFASEDPKRAYVVAVSQQPATTAEESQRDALAAAARSLKHRVSDQMNPPTRQMLWMKADAEPWLEGRIAAELQNGQMIADRFVQRLTAPYGEVWQTSLLVDASPKNIAGLAAKCDRLMALQERGTRRTALSVAGVIALVCLVYAGLNAVTRGYFSWSLRAMALAMMAGGVFLILLFRG